MKTSPSLESASRLKVEGVGIRAFQRIGGFVKPSTRMIQTFGHLARRAVVRLNEVQLEKLVKGEPIAVALEVEKGYVILSLGGHILGLGLYMDGKVYSQLPRKHLTFFVRGAPCD